MNLNQITDYLGARLVVLRAVYPYISRISTNARVYYIGFLVCHMNYSIEGGRE